jgi:uncharacterized protein with FMN-binding domain
MRWKSLVLHLKLFGTLLAAGCASFPLSQPLYRDGTYRGIGEGYRGPVEVSLRVEDGAIADIRVEAHQDDPLTGGAALEELLEGVLLTNSPELDAVSGATGTSEGFLSAVEDALLQAALPGQQGAGAVTSP